MIKFCNEKLSSSLFSMMENLKKYFSLVSITAPFLFASILAITLLNLDQSRELVSISLQNESNLIWQHIHGFLILSYYFCSLFCCLKIYSFVSTDSTAFYKKISLAYFLVLSSLIPLFLFRSLGLKLGYFVPLFVGLIVTFFVFLTHVNNKNISKLITVFILLSLFTILAASYFSTVSIETAVNMGGLGILVLSICLWTTVFTVVFGILPSYYLKRTFYVAGLFIVLSMNFFSFSPEKVNTKSPHLIARELYPIQKNSPPVAEYFEEWIKKFKLLDGQKKERIPVYLVVSEGGGIRAAYWTAAVLSELDIKSRGMVSNNTFVYSGISGGAVGIGIYKVCQDKSQLTQRDCALNGLSKDILSPTLARILLSEPLRLLPVFKDLILPRDVIFEKTLELAPSSEVSQKLLQSPLRSIFDTNNSLSPVIFFGATDANTGKRVYLSNVNISSNNLTGETPINLIDEYKRDVPLSYALHASARFPLISPPSYFGSYTLVDGGYRENSGINEISAFFEELIATIEKITKRHEIKAGFLDCRSASDSVEKYGGCRNYEELREDISHEILKHAPYEALSGLLDRLELKVIVIRNNEKPIIKKLNNELIVVINSVLSSRVSRTDDSLSKFKLDIKKYENHKSGGIECNNYHLVSNVYPNLYTFCRDNVVNDQFGDENDKNLDINEHESYECVPEAVYMLVGAADRLYASCFNEPPRYQLIEFNLFEKDDLGQVPLGWTLSTSSTEKIKKLAKQQVLENWKYLEPSESW